MVFVKLVVLSNILFSDPRRPRHLIRLGQMFIMWWILLQNFQYNRQIDRVLKHSTYSQSRYWFLHVQPVNQYFSEMLFIWKLYNLLHFFAFKQETIPSHLNIFLKMEVILNRFSFCNIVVTCCSFLILHFSS